MTNFDLVKEFHRTFGHPVREKLTPVSSEEKILRMKLIDEEVRELREALFLHSDDPMNNLIAAADALGDILYVVYGAAATFGIDVDVVLREIHRSNMTKLGEDGKPIYREDGKVLKGPNYEPPNILAVLNDTV